MKVTLKTNLYAILFAIVFPTIVTLVYFVLLDGQSATIQQSSYAVLKVIQFAFPAFWVFMVVRKRFRWSSPTAQGITMGLVFGALVAAVMVGLALGVLEPMGFFDRGADGATPRDQIRDKIQDLGLDSAGRFLALGVFYALFHSLLEEYYWRWFVFKRLRPYTTLVNAIAVSSLGFMAHHVILLGTYFGWTSPATYLFSASVAVGGAVWAWIYEKSESLYGPWLSHMLVDAAIFFIGYRLAADLW